ncbi:chymotrypsin family serine protease [Amycolatopsis samaneae]|uniref:Nal1 N-terminal domain-containing protein n=2 Tax=Amycolatopsis samaneae TaxID=664691 RepID=A0ABW5GES6_9PSEU
MDRAIAAGLDRVKRRLREDHADDPNIAGIAKGFRTRGGALTDEPVVVVMVLKKRREALVSRRRLLPKTVEFEGRDYGVDVVETGEFCFSRATGEEASGTTADTAITERFRPPLHGASVGNLAAGTQGTLGCLVRDRTDGTICVLSANHVLADFGRAEIGAPIVQPSGRDGGADQANVVARLKRFIPLATGTLNTADAAIAELVPGIGISATVARNLMAPVSPTHPAVGLAFVASVHGGTFMAKIDTVLRQLDVEPLTPGSTVPAVEGRRIEKVGRTSGYTSSVILDTSAFVMVNGYQFGDLIFAQRFSLAGDSGAIVCEGGNGRTPTPVPSIKCRALGDAGTFYDLPLAEDNALADRARDEFLAESATGNLLIQVIYRNLETGMDRLRAAGAGSAEERRQARQFYDKYHALVAAVLADPGSAVTLTREHLDDIRHVFAGLSPELVTRAEKEALWVLFDEVVTPALGKNRQQLLDHMNDIAVYHRVREKLLSLPGLDVDASYGFSSTR